MKIWRIISALLAAAMLTVGSCGYVAAFAEEEEYVSEEAPREVSEDSGEERQEEKTSESREEAPVREESVQSSEDEGEWEDAPELPSDDEKKHSSDEKIEEIREEPEEELDDGKTETEITPEPDEETGETEGTEETGETEGTEETGEKAEKGSISVSGGKSVKAGTKTSFKLRASNVVSMSYRIVGPDGETVASGDLDASADSVSFTPKAAGEYTLVVSGVGMDGGEVSDRATVTVGKLGELSLKVQANSECCHAGDATGFTISLSGDAEVAACSIVATQGSKKFFESANFTESVSVNVPQTNSVTKVTLTVKVKDALDRTAEASATIPCAVHEREKRSHWEATMAGVQLTGVWPDDLIVIAKTQVGYKESSKDFGEKHGGGLSGYTRYGDWAGMPYDEWCAMFASFCLHYAGVPENVFPRASNQQRWIKSLSKIDLYATRDAYTPQLGDLVFFDWNGDGTSDHVGIVAKLDTNKKGAVKGFTTIEGNSKGGAVTFNDRYSVNDSTVMGYGLVNEAYARMIRDEVIEAPVEEEEEVELPEEPAPVVVREPVRVSASYGKEANLPSGCTVKFTVIRPGDEGFDAYVDLLREALDEDNELGDARFMEISLVDAYGEPVEPEGPVKLTVSYDEKLNASRAMRPGVATIGGADGVLINTDVDLERGDDGIVYSFTQEEAQGVICTYVSGKLKYKKNAVEADDGDVTARLSYSASSRVPAGATLTLREIKRTDPEYKTCMAHVEKKTGKVRFFEVGLNLNGMRIDPQGEVNLTFYCHQAAGDVRAMRVSDDQSFEAKLSKRINGETVVRLDIDDFGIFALDFIEEED